MWLIGALCEATSNTFKSSTLDYLAKCCGWETAVIGTILRIYKALKIEVKDQTFPFSSESHVEFGLKYLCIYMKHNCVGETNLSLIIIKSGTCSLSNEKATVRTK